MLDPLGADGAGTILGGGGCKPAEEDSGQFLIWNWFWAGICVQSYVHNMYICKHVKCYTTYSSIQLVDYAKKIIYKLMPLTFKRG